MNGLLLEAALPGLIGATVEQLCARPSFTNRRSFLVLDDAYTLGTLRAGELTVARAERLVYRVHAALEPLRVLGLESPALAGDAEAQFRYLAPHLHLTPVLEVGDEEMLTRLDNTARLYNPVLVMLTVPERSLSPECRARQAMMLELLSQSTLPSEVIDVEALGHGRAAERLEALLLAGG